MKKTICSTRREMLLGTAAALLPAGLLVCCRYDSSGNGGGTTSSTPPTLAPSTMTLGIAIVVDQFGYLPDQKKVAVARDPQVGFDAADSFTPGTVYNVVRASDNKVVYTGTPVAWNNGATDASSGDAAWQFDFSAVTAPGTYFIRDTLKKVKSYDFTIGATVYVPVLRAAVRMLYYQRASTDKPAAYAGADWSDGLAGCGSLQDKNARLYTAPDDASTERDLSGGWYDAGDFNRYTASMSGYIINLLHAYAENPTILVENNNIPESGNGLPDLLDEIKWGLDWLKKMQNADGSVLSYLGVASASPPSAATGQSLYRPANTWVTRFAAAAYAFGAKVFGGISGQAAYAADLLTCAENAWIWCEANPSVVLSGSQPQESDDYGRLCAALIAATHLFETTGKSAYRNWVDANYQKTHLFVYNNFVYPYEPDIQSALLYYASLSGATAATASAIKNAYVTGMNGSDNWGAVTSGTDPYMAHLSSYTWGSNNIKMLQGELFAAMARYNLGTHTADEAMTAASHYIHYLHGVNPLGKVYLTNMASLGASNSVDCMWHGWFSWDSPKWKSVKNSTFGPPPGYLVGGPNESYNWESGCPTLNSACGTTVPSPPYGQPKQKSYKDFNDPWPLDSWSITEPSCGYQIAYIRLLSKFVH